MHNSYPIQPIARQSARGRSGIVSSALRVPGSLRGWGGCLGGGGCGGGGGGCWLLVGGDDGRCCGDGHWLRATRGGGWRLVHACKPSFFRFDSVKFFDGRNFGEIIFFTFFLNFCARF